MAIQLAKAFGAKVIVTVGSASFGCLSRSECDSELIRLDLNADYTGDDATLQNQATGRVLDDSDYGLRAFTYYGPAAPYQAWSVY